jgi:hypothetical protein
MEKNLKTIVGGRSTPCRDSVGFPRGIEILLKKAKVDPRFRKLLLQDPVAASRSIELSLEDSEKKILLNTPGEVIEKMVESSFVPKHHVSTFMNARAAAMLSLVLATSVLVPGHASAGVEATPEPDQEQLESKEQLIKARMAIIQEALEHYKSDYGVYPSTLAWVTGSPLEEYIEPIHFYDPWYRKFHYRGVVDQNGIISNYWLKCLGQDEESPLDDIHSPIDAAIHKFSADNPLRITYPRSNLILHLPTPAHSPIMLIAEHRSSEVLLDWYLDGKKIGSTSGEHALALPDGSPSGKHLLLVIDEEGNHNSVSFHVKQRH